MRLQEALFLSSQKTAIYEHGISSLKADYTYYRVQVAIKQEEYQDRFKQESAKPYDVYEITVSRRKGETVYPPHLTERFKYLRECLEYLEKWTVGEEFEHPWQPVEEWEPKPITKQTELAESILEWVDMYRKKMQEMSSEGVTSTLATFMIDVENLCHVYLEDGEEQA